jgi:hypothetical protein
MTDISPGIGFVAMQPCRVFDTRNANGPYGGPRLVANATRNFDIDSGPCAPIPAGVEAYSMNFGAILPDGANSFITIWPTGTAQPLVSSINPIQGVVVANAAIVPAGTSGQISVFPNTGVHLYGDINGYFTGEYNPGVRLFAQITGAGGAVQGRNLSTQSNAFGIEGSISITNPASLSAGVRGINDGTGASGVGVWGSQAGSGWGVYGETPTGVGVYGQITSTTPPNGSAGVRGTNNGTGAAGVGVWGSHAGSGWGVFGEAPTGYGVVGRIATDTANRAGVIGQTGFVSPAGGYSAAGVRGEGRTGVLGVAGNFLGGGEGVSASLVDGFGAEIRYAGLATSFGTDPSGGSAPWAVFGGGDIGATGTKHFLDPHPSDPNLMIAYVSLEGPEAGTYFRGRGKFQDGLARITVPEHFRMVTDPEGLTVQITPIGAMASFAVIKMDLNEIVVQASRSVEFSYLVQGVRATFKDLSPYRSGGFMPRTADAKIPAWLSPAQKRLLIQNGTYSEDGVVNMETARRLGWDKIWEQLPRSRPQPTEP